MKSFFTVYSFLFYISLLTAPGLIILFPNDKNTTLACIEFIAELTLLGQLTLSLIKKSKNFNQSNILIFLSMLCLFLADSIYNLQVLKFINKDYDFIADILFSVFSIFLMLFLIKKLNIGNRKIVVWIIPFLMILIIKMTLVYQFLLSPYYLTQTSAAYKINETVYFIISSIIFSLILSFSIRITDRTTFWFLNSILLLLMSNFAISYHDSFLDANTFSWAESAWCATIIGFIWSAHLCNKQDQELFITRNLSLASFFSIRSLLPLAIFSVNICLLIGILLFKTPFLETAIDVSSLLLLLFLFWTIANEFSIWLANDLQNTLGNMFKANEILSSEGDIQLNLEQVSIKNPIFEISRILDSYNSLVKQTNHLIRMALETNKNAAIASIASQVSHDIRSPLAALSMTLEITQTLPEEIRLLMRSSISRIRDIANNLSEPALMNNKNYPSIEKKQLHTLLLSSVIENLITEKRMQFRSQIGIEIEANLGLLSYGIFSKIDLVEFKRMLSNLVNNAVESLQPTGKISITLEKNENVAIISITDNGIGIPAHILEKLGERGFSYHKKNGSGLGLYHAKTTVHLWGGNLKIISTKKQGTTVTVELPLTDSPRWFVQKLFLTHLQTIVILDDDTSIHQIWRGRLRSFIKKSALVSLSTPTQLKNWVIKNQSPQKNILFLIDHELLGFPETGLDLIQTLNLQKISILVTSHFEEIAILERCQAQGIQLIPKDMAPFIPIEA